MANRYVIKSKAREDLNLIFAYIYEDNPKAARKLYETFFEKFELLSIFPETGRLRKEFSPVVRSLAVGNYVIFFAEKNPVEIVRVLHGARYFPADIEEL